jgi:predicted DNA binding CopG/RHH family protein
MGSNRSFRDGAASETQSPNLRVYKALLQAIKTRAAAEGISYQKFIRMTLEHTVSRFGGD